MRITFYICLFLCLFAGRLVKAEPIDIVYTWVDGSDPSWQTCHSFWEEKISHTQKSRAGHSKNRFRDRQELKYSLRSVVRYAPFVNHIYIVTFGQKPFWLKPHPKITVVDHKEIFSNPAVLPTFNSQAIEANLHHIAALSERFIYFNDDVFLNAPVSESDFFYEKGIVVNLGDYWTPKGPIDSSEEATVHSWKNTNNLLDNTFCAEDRWEIAHAPEALQKSFMREAEERFPLVFSAVSSHRFRNPNDFVMTNGLIQYFAYYTNRAKLVKQSNLVILTNRMLDNVRRDILKLDDHNILFFCVQDSCAEDNKELNQMIVNELERKFPEKAPWEK